MSFVLTSPFLIFLVLTALSLSFLGPMVGLAAAPVTLAPSRLSAAMAARAVWVILRRRWRVISRSLISVVLMSEPPARAGITFAWTG